MLGRYSDALPILGYALGLDKDEPVALSGRAYALAMLERDDEAWPDVERSLRFYPTNPYALRTRAILHLRKGELVKACEDLSFAKAVGDLAEVDRLLKEHCQGAGQGGK
jgi:Flp pilus assembly protein TadD